MNNIPLNIPSSVPPQAVNDSWMKTIVSLPYKAVKGTIGLGAESIRWVAKPIIDISGQILYTATSNTDHSITHLITGSCFGFVGWKGLKMLAAPFSNYDKYMKFDFRFKSEYKMKHKLVKISDLLNQDMKKSLEEYDKAKNKVNETKQKLDEAKNELQQTQNLQPTYDNQWLQEQAQIKVHKAELELNKAEEELKELSLKPLNPKPSSSQTIPEAKKEDPLAGTYVNRTTIEKTKKSPDEWHIPIPLSNETLIFNHQEFKKAWSRFGTGLSLIGISYLGIRGSIESGRGPIYDKEGNLVTPDWFSWSKVAYLISAPANFVISTVGTVLSGLMTAKPLGYPVGSLIAAGGLGFGGYKTLKSTEFIWFKFKDNKGGKIQWDTIQSDLLKVAGGVTLIGAAILSADDFFQS